MPAPKPKLKTTPPREGYKVKARLLGEKLMHGLFGATVRLSGGRDIVQNNYDLGLKHLKLGNIKDAVLRFKLVVWLDPAHAEGWYQLGRALLAEGKAPRAAEAIKKSLSLRPGHEEAAYMLALALGRKAPLETLPRKIPAALALAHFEARAADFTRDQLETCRYQGHKLLADAVRARLMPGRIDHAILDLGCGTGLVGPCFADVAAHTTGVDFSQAMLKEAMKVATADGKKIYDALVHRELHDFLLSASPDSWDIVLAASTFNYVGDLQDVFRQAIRVLKPGGLFGCTVEKLDGDGWRFDPEAGCFRFSQTYVEELGQASGFAEFACGEAEVYPGEKMWACVFRKGM